GACSRSPCCEGSPALLSCFPAVQPLRGLPLEIRDLFGLHVRLLLRRGELVLGLALALLLAPLAAEARVAGHVAGGFLRSTGDLVEQSHSALLIRVAGYLPEAPSGKRWPWTRSRPTHPRRAPL